MNNMRIFIGAFLNCNSRVVIVCLVKMQNNLITGTRYLNMVGMLPFENMVDDYVDAYSNHVIYRVTPVFEGDSLIADGVLMEGWSVEDSGKGICFNVYYYNVQPGIEINYSNGEFHPSDDVIVCNEGTYKFDVQQPD